MLPQAKAMNSQTASPAGPTDGDSVSFERRHLEQIDSDGRQRQSSKRIDESDRPHRLRTRQDSWSVNLTTNLREIARTVAEVGGHGF